MSIEVNCTTCQRIFYSSTIPANHALKCPGCKTLVQLPTSPQKLSSRNNPKKVACPKCRSTLLISINLAGRRVVCNTCQTALVVCDDPLSVVIAESNFTADAKGRTSLLDQLATPNASRSVRRPIVKHAAPRKKLTHQMESDSIVHQKHLTDQHLTDQHLTDQHLTDQHLSKSHYSDEKTKRSRQRTRDSSAQTASSSHRPTGAEASETNKIPVSDMARGYVALRLQRFESQRTHADVRSNASSHQTNAAATESEDSIPIYKKTLPVTALACVVLLTAIVVLCLPTDGMARRALTGAVLGAGDQGGEITFEPMGPPQRPSAAAKIDQGNYAFDHTNGPCSGLYRVSITLDQATVPERKPLAVLVPDEAPWSLDIGN